MPPYLMSHSLDELQKEVVQLRKDVDDMKHILHEDGELTEYAERAIEKARGRPESDYIELT